MRVEVDAARKQELAARVDLAIGPNDIIYGRDALAFDPDVGAPLAVRRDNEPAADR